MWLTLYLLNVAGTGLLLRDLYDKRAWRTHPAFFAFIGFAFARTITLLPLRATGKNPEYAYVWLFTVPVVIALSAWTVGEIWRVPKFGKVAGYGIAAILYALIWTTFRFVKSANGYAAAAYLAERSVMRWSFYTLAALAIAYAIKYAHDRAGGMALVCYVSGILLSDDLYGQNRFQLGVLVIAAWTVALFLFLRWSNRYRVHSPHPTRPYLINKARRYESRSLRESFN